MSFGVSPLVISLRCEGNGWRTCEELRRVHFPAERNVVPAHVALFHHLPGEELDTIASQLRKACKRIEPFPVPVTRPRSLGRGVALQIESPELITLRAALALAWANWLTPQDRAPFSPHVTIQNKVEPAQARALFVTLKARFSPFTFRATGVEIWHYRNGPWEFAAVEYFSQPRASHVE